MIVGKSKITGDKKKEIKIKNTFEKVDNFKYLGVLINENNKKDFEIQERIKKANKAYFCYRTYLNPNTYPKH